MKCQMNGNEWRRSFTTILLGAIALASLLIGSYSDNTNPIKSIGSLVITMSSLLLMVFLLIENLKSLGFRNKNIVTGETDIQVSSLEAKYKTIETVTGFVPETSRIEEKSKEEESLSDELKKILDLSNGLLLPNCLKGLELLAQHESVVQKSSTQTLNKARLLAATGQLTEAERLAFDVIKKFSHSNEAIGIAHEVLSFIEEFREPEEKGALYQQWLKKRRDHVMEGLKFFPTGHFLLMNAFEIATLQCNASEVLTYLNRAVRADRERTQHNLAVNPLTQKSMGLSPEIRDTIKGLIEGDNKMKIFEMIRVRALILVLILTATLGLCCQIRKLPHTSVSVLTATATLCEKAKSLGYFSSREGTGFGRMATDFKSIGTGFGE
jgi:hypothetical protein